MLDDAIREHLELKRLRGADPGEIAREQREALDVAREEPLAAEPAAPAEEFDDAPGAAEAQVALPEEEAPEPQAGTDVPYDDQVEPGGTVLGEETAELDMQTVLDEGADPTSGEPATTPSLAGTPDEQPSAQEVSPGDHAAAAGELEEDELADVPRQIPGQERMPFE